MIRMNERVTGNVRSIELTITMSNIVKENRDIENDEMRLVIIKKQSRSEITQNINSSELR